MSIISRYVFLQAASALLLILASLGGIVWIALALRQLNVVTSQGQDAWMLIKMTTLALPNLLAIIAPFALLIGALHVLNRLNGDSELIVLTAAGGTVWSVARPLLALGLLVMLAVGIVNHVGMPWSLRLLKEYIVKVRTDLLTQVIQPGQFTSPEKGLTFHIRERAPSGELLGLVMNDVRDRKVAQTFLAETGVIVKQEPAAYLIMSKGHILRREEGDKPAEVIAFEKYAVDLERLDRKTDGDVHLKPRERYFDELVRPMQDDVLFRENPGQFRAELHERFANPLYPIAFVLIAIAAIGQAQSTRQNRTERMIMGFVLAAAVRLAGLAVSNLVVIDARYIVVLYAIPILAMVAAFLVILRNARPRAGPTLSDRIGDLLAPLLARLPRPSFSRAGAKGQPGTQPV
ncbi:MAG: LPS export ABC transporter permease LptF [Hyphomicrobiaceae bacterium]|nr:LPS export ABC transporter permease LptF [Hyphomicrobiaceae bacterium]